MPSHETNFPSVHFREKAHTFAFQFPIHLQWQCQYWQWARSIIKQNTKIGVHKKNKYAQIVYNSVKRWWVKGDTWHLPTVGDKRICRLIRSHELRLSIHIYISTETGNELFRSKQYDRILNVTKVTKVTKVSDLGESFGF
jgi:hypothetical protein